MGQGSEIGEFCVALLEVFAQRWAQSWAERFLVALKSKFLPTLAVTQWAQRAAGLGAMFYPLYAVFYPFLQHFTHLCCISPLCAAFHPLFLFSAQKWPQVWDEGNPSPGILTLCMQISGSLDKLSMQREFFIFIWFFFWGISRFKGSHENLSEGNGEIWIAVNNNRESWGS